MSIQTHRCPCGGASHVPQLRMIRIPGTFKGMAYHTFCMGGCNREGVGVTSEQSAELWNASIEADRAFDESKGRDMSRYADITATVY